MFIAKQTTLIQTDTAPQLSTGKHRSTTTLYYIFAHNWQKEIKEGFHTTARYRRTLRIRRNTQNHRRMLIRPFTATHEDLNTECIKMIGAVLKLIIFTSMVNRIVNTSRNERVTQQVYDTYLQIFDVWTLRHKAHIEAIVQFLPYSAQQVRCDGLHSRDNSVLQIRTWPARSPDITPCDYFLWG